MDKSRNQLTLLILGIVIGGAIISSLVGHPEHRRLGVYVAALGLFHTLEFLFASYFHPKTTDYHAFLLDHSHAYTGSILMALTEYFVVSSLLWPTLRHHRALGTIGLIAIIGGQLLRSAAMYWAGSAFTHEIAYEQSKGHCLVQNGIYRYVRHPSYLGYYIWSLGTQLTLSNPLSFIIYTIVLYRFFYDRIREEEEQLCRFFPKEYPAYRKKCWSGIPGVA